MLRGQRTDQALRVKNFDSKEKYLSSFRRIISFYEADLIYTAIHATSTPAFANEIYI